MFCENVLRCGTSFKQHLQSKHEAAFAKLRSKEKNEGMTFDKYATIGVITAHLIAVNGYASKHLYFIENSWHMFHDFTISCQRDSFSMAWVSQDKTKMESSKPRQDKQN